MRLAFAVAAHLESDILLVDEVLAVGDAAFQKRCLGKMGTVAREGRTVVLVSHHMPAIMSLCNRVCIYVMGASWRKACRRTLCSGTLNRSVEVRDSTDERPYCSGMAADHRVPPSHKHGSGYDHSPDKPLEIDDWLSQHAADFRPQFVVSILPCTGYGNLSFAQRLCWRFARDLAPRRQCYLYNRPHQFNARAMLRPR